MDILKRELAPVSSAAWRLIDAEARRVLKLHLAGRKLVDFTGPQGWHFGAVNTGRLIPIKASPISQVAHSIRDVRPLVELRTAFELTIQELDCADRGALDLELQSVVSAAELLARAEDSSIFHGFEAGGITGIIAASPHPPIDVAANVEWPRAVSAAAERLRLSGINGPYALALGGRGYDELTADGDDGYPISRRIEDTVIDGKVVWAPVLREGAALISLRGGDYELTVGQDASVGYTAHDREKVELFLTESFTFRVLEPKAAILLRRASQSAK